MERLCRLNVHIEPQKSYCRSLYPLNIGCFCSSDSCKSVIHLFYPRVIYNPINLPLLHRAYILRFYLVNNYGNYVWHFALLQRKYLPVVENTYKEQPLINCADSSNNLTATTTGITCRNISFASFVLTMHKFLSKDNILVYASKRPNTKHTEEVIINSTQNIPFANFVLFTNYNDFTGKII